MEPYQDRVVEEREELSKKLGQLGEFLGSEVYSGLPAGEQRLLVRQHQLMFEYGAILGKRIEKFESKE